MGAIRALGTGGSIAFTPDGRTLAMTSTGSLTGFAGTALGHIELWDVTDPAIPVWRASFGFNQVDLGGESISFSPQSPTPYLAVTSSVVAVWNVEPSSVVRHVCLSAGEPVSRAQWARYVPDLPFHAPCPAGR